MATDFNGLDQQTMDIWANLKKDTSLPILDPAGATLGPPKAPEFQFQYDPKTGTGGLPKKGTQANALDQGWTSWLSDWARANAANKANRTEMQGQIAGMQGTTDSLTSQFGDLAGQSSWALNQEAGKVERLGASQEKDATGRVDQILGGLSQSGQHLMGTASSAADAMMKQAANVRGEVFGDVNEGYKLADQAAQAFGLEVDKFEAYSANEIDRDAHAIRANSANQLELIKGGINPQTGQPFAPGEQGQVLYQAQKATEAQVNDTTMRYGIAAAQLGMQLKKQLADFRNIAAGARQEGAKTKLAAGTEEGSVIAAAGALKTGTEGQVRSGDTAARLQGTAQIQQAQAGRAEAQKVTSTMQQFIQQLQGAWLTQVGNFQMQGRTEMANWTSANKQSVVSLFNGITAMMALMSAPGSGAIPAMKLPSQLT